MWIPSISDDENVSESLAGRLGILTLLGLSMREQCGIDLKEPFSPEDNYFIKRRDGLPDISYDNIWEMIYRGSMPELCMTILLGVIIVMTIVMIVYTYFVYKKYK